MSVSQKKFREIVFQMLFSHDLGGVSEGKALALMNDQFKVTSKNLYTAWEYAQQVLDHLEEIDRWIAEHSTDYDFNRISRVEKNILRLGVFELKWVEAVPPKVAIAESIRLSRKFGTPEGGAFVNAVLDSIHVSQEKACPSQIASSTTIV